MFDSTVSFGGNENVLELDRAGGYIMLAMCTKCHSTVHFTMANFMRCESHLL